jgi:hypothetical protein
MFAKVGEGFSKVRDVIFAFLASHNDVIDVCRDIPVQLCIEYSYDNSVERASCVAKPLRHSYIAVSAEGSGKAGLLLI